jgi:non-hemolytic enterotoxin B/C
MTTTAPVSTSKAKLSSSSLKTGLEASASASMVIQAYANGILKQSDVNLSLIPELPGHQAIARKHANNWLNNVNPSMLKTNNDIVDFANQFDAYYAPLVTLAKNIQAGDKSARTTFAQGLSDLRNAINKKENNTITIVSDLNKFHDELTTDYRNFQADDKTAKDKITGDKGEIAALDDQLTAIHDAMNKDIGMIAGGCVGTVVGVCMVVAGAALEFETAGASTALIVAGLGVAAGGASTTIIGSVDYSHQVSKLKSTTSKLNHVKMEVVSLKVVKTQVDGLVNNLGEAITAVSDLQSSWNILKNDFDELISALDDVSTSSFFLLAKLDHAKKDWEDVRAQAVKLQANGQMKVETKKLA